MLGVQIDSYFDITCSDCGRSRSTDYMYGLETDRVRLRKLAKSEGWVAKELPNGSVRTLCPSCASLCKNINCLYQHFAPDADKSECKNASLGGFCWEAKRRNVALNPAATACFSVDLNGKW